MIKEEELKKPKKWASGRAGIKKKVTETDDTFKRKFNPRLPPFRTLEKKRHVEIKIDHSDENFPSLTKD